MILSRIDKRSHDAGKKQILLTAPSFVDKWWHHIVSALSHCKISLDVAPSWNLLLALDVHTTTGKVLFSFRTDKHSVFIPYRLKQVPCRHRVNGRPIRNDFVLFPNHVYRHCVNGASVDVCCYFKIRLLQHKWSLVIQFIFCAPPPPYGNSATYSFLLSCLLLGFSLPYGGADKKWNDPSCRTATARVWFNSIR